jgi:hypothetical protein
MRASRIVAATLSVAIVGGLILNLSHGLANATAMYDVCRNEQLSFTRQSQCIDEMKSASSEVARKDVAARYQNMITAKVAAEQGVSLPAPTNVN